MSNKIFDCADNCLLDSDERVKENVLNSTVNAFNELSKNSFVVTLFEKKKNNKKEDFVIKDLTYILPLEYSREDNFFVTKFLDNLISNAINEKTYGSSYNRIMPAVCLGQGPVCITNDESKNALNDYLKKDFESIKTELKNKNYDYVAMFSSYADSLQNRAKEVANALDNLNNLFSSVVKKQTYVSSIYSKMTDEIEILKNNALFAEQDATVLKNVKKNYGNEIRKHVDILKICDSLEKIVENVELFFLSKEDYLKYYEQDIVYKNKLTEYIEKNVYKDDDCSNFFEIIKPYIKLKMDALKTTISSYSAIIKKYNEIVVTSQNNDFLKNLVNSAIDKIKVLV